MRPRTIVILSLTVLLLNAGSLWMLYGSERTHVKRVSVSGARVLTPEEVRAVAKVRLGSPLVSVDTDRVAARLRRELPRIDSVDVERSWPDGIELKVVERTPVMVEEKGGKFVEVDRDGVRFATVSQAPKGVPVLELSLSRSSSAAASLRRFGESRLVREAVTVAGQIPAAVARETRVVKVRTYDDISLELSDGRTVAWGSSANGRLKVRALTALMKAAPEARHFDVRVPTAPASTGS